MTKHDKYFIYLLLLAAVLFVTNLGSALLFDWDEINFAEAAREMVVTGDYLTVKIDYQIFHEKPPFFFWLQAASMNVFGFNAFAARLPNAIIGLISLIFLYLVGAKEKSKEFGFNWAIVYFGSILPFFYFKFGIIDPLFNLLIFSSIYLYYLFYKENNFTYLIYSSIACGAAILTKGPVALLLVGGTLALYFAFKKNLFSQIKYLILFSVIALLPIIAWYLVIYLFYNPNIFIDFWNYQLRLLNTEDAGHGGPFWYHFPVVLIGCFPASFLAIAYIRKLNFKSLEAFQLINIILLALVLIIFSVVKTKIVHYSSLTYFPITFFAAYYLTDFVQSGKVSKLIKWNLIGISFVLGLCVVVFPHILVYVQQQITNGNTSLIKDKFARDLLAKPVYWNYTELVIPFSFFAMLAFSIYLLLKNKLQTYFYSVLLSVSFLIFTVQSLYAPKVEEILQGTIVDYLTFIKKQDNVYFRILGYKSYTQYFYGEKKENQSLLSKFKNREDEEEWLLKSNIDRDAYFICKAKDCDKYISEKVTLLNKSYGYALLMRKK